MTLRVSGPMRARSTSRPADRPGTVAGAWAELEARFHLEAAGFRFRAANYREKRGEIDLIMVEGSTLVFVEVRQRARSDFGTAAESIDARKLARIMRTARLYMLRHLDGDDTECRFDAVLVTGTENDFRLEHLRDIVG